VAGSYRPDIDGLRAVAVLAVVAFHASAPIAPGGFVGVDIFFVISGYLITSLLVREIDSGTYSTWRFYERRLRRIAPASLVVCAVASVVAALIYLPSEFELFGKSLTASLLIHANIFFYKEAGYFQAPEDVMPLLHIWSLSVEEQFYVFFPIVLVLLSKWRIRKLGIVLLLLASFIASCVAVVVTPDAAFYLAQYRAWELLLGSLLALGMVPQPDRRAANIASWLGGALIIFSIWGLSSRSTFPGWNAAFPCLGAILLIYAGPQAMLNRWLSSAPAVGVGLISYSLYLWHWPLLAFGAAIVMRPLHPQEAAIAVALAFVLAWLSYRFVETPFRRPINRVSLTPIFASIALLFAVSATATFTEGAGWRLSADAVRLDAVAKKYGMRENCRPSELAQSDERVRRLTRTIELCVLGDPTVEPTVILWGDSHAGAVAPGLNEALAQAGKSGYQFSQPGCPPIENIDQISRYTGRCKDMRDLVFETISSFGKKPVIILAARWAYYFEGTPYTNERERDPFILSPAEMFAPVSAGLDGALAKLRETGASIAIMTSVPEVSYDVPSAMGRTQILGLELDLAPTRAEYDARQRRADMELTELAEKYGATLLNAGAHLCNGDKCEIQREGVPLYTDNDHLSVFGTMVLAPMFTQVIAP